MESNPEITNNVPGIVIVRNIISVTDQLKLIDIIENAGGLKDINGDYNFFKLRGRRFSNLNKYDEFLMNVMQKIKTIVEEIDKTLVWIPFSKNI